MANEFFVSWVDEDGVETRSSMYVVASNPALQPIQNLIAALGSVSAAGITKYGIIINGTPDPAVLVGTGPFDAADKLVLECQTSLGTIAQITVPGPSTDLLDDSDTVSAADLGGVVLTALFDALKAIWKYDGATLVTLLRGYRIRTARHDVA